VPFEVQEQIFLRFYEKSTPHLSEKKGTGIGLAISKEIMEMHKGKLEIESKEGEGSTFIVTLKKGNNHFEQTHLLDRPPVSTTSKIDVSEIRDFVQENENIEDNISSNQSLINQWERERQLILLVDDNDEVRSFLINLLRSKFNLLHAANGKIALSLCIKNNPDLIISDIMMPEMDGIELVQSVKSRVEISHIPIILLTAKTTVESKLQGLTEGADDYITKPFNPEELILRIKNLINLRKVAKEKFAKIISLDPKEIAISNLDETLLKDMMVLLEKNMENNNYSVDQMANDLAMSRTTLFSKIKNITDMTPNNFIRNYKMKRAAFLLKSGKYNVSEVCYKVGFKDPKYFRKLFFQEFGINPSDYYEAELESNQQ
jgi:DNA-binding response OmpR family regulator